MKHSAFWIWLISACVIAFPARGLAAYLIELKNGSRYVTHDYWEEGNQIKFNFSGGQIGFSKDSVLKITDTDLPVKDEIVTPEMPSTEAEPAPEAATPSQPAPDETQAPAVSEKTGQDIPKPEAASEETVERESAAPGSEKTGKDAMDPEAAKAYADQKVALVKRLEMELKALKRETGKEKDEFWIEKRKEKIREVRARIETLGREVAGKNSGVLPGWWNDIPVPADE